MFKVSMSQVCGHLWVGNGHFFYILDLKSIEKCLQDIQHYMLLKI